jgi:ubiquinone/menaquinone biosynthesis C-methylase UbiE
MAEMNERERARWNDARWASLWPKREMLTREVTRYLIEAAALQPGEQVLDVGSGGGGTSLAASDAVFPSGSVVGADISGPLVALAVRRADVAGAVDVRFQVVDMQTGQAQGGPFDVAISQFGVMFFEDPVAAFANIRAQLAPTGRLAFATWQPPERNRWLAWKAIEQWIPAPPPPPPGRPATGPFQLADPAYTVPMLEAAGFADVRRVEHELVVDAPPSSVVDDDEVEARGVPEEHHAEAQAALDTYMAQFAVDGETSRFPIAFQILTARVA